VGQAGLAGPGIAPTADHPRRAGARVGTSERALPEETGRRLLGHQGVDLGDRDGLRQGERWQDAGQPPSEHGLARTWRSQEEEVVSAGGGDLQRPFRHLLAPYLRQVRDRRGSVAIERLSGYGRQRSGSREVMDGLGQSLKANDRDGFQSRRLGSVRRRQEHLPGSEAPPQVRDGEAAAHGADGSVEP
jgi:hypothetical protein